jgi:nucleolar protein 56
MRAYIVSTIVGVFAVDENNRLLSSKAFPKEPRAAAEKLKLSEIEMLDEERFVRDVLGKKGFREFIFGYRKAGVRHVEPNSLAEQFVKENVRKLAVEAKMFSNPADLNQFLTKATIELAKVHIKKSIQRDSLVVQANGALEDLDKSINIYMERLREWYGLHFPEMDRAVSGHEKFATLVAKFGDRENVTDADVEGLKKNSMGADLEDEDIKMMQSFAGKILEMYKLREDMVNYVEGILKKVAPNLLDVAGVSLAMRMIAKSGGLARLSRMPSSTIQLIGAEKALFRFLKGKGRSPRHGIIFGHPLIQGARDEHRGKLARLVASKMSIAAKLDYYGKEYRGDKLKREMTEKAKTIVSSKA